MEMIRGIRLALLALGVSGALAGAEPFYLGTWKISGAAVAPWWSDARQKPDPSGVRQMNGRMVVITPGRITGPGLLACAKPKYLVKQVPAEGLFQGMFEEMQRRDPKVKAAQVAAGVGFQGKEWKTLDTGCENELELHFLDERTAAFGLDNYIFTLKKQ